MEIANRKYSLGLRNILLIAHLFSFCFLASCIKNDAHISNTITHEELSAKGGKGKGGGKALKNSLVDVDGNVYKTVTIGKQVWMAENLRVSRYRDSTPIPNITDHDLWSSTINGAWCYYQNDSATHDQPYGKLYNFFAVDDPNSTIAPIGWHIPDTAEWNTLFNTLNGMDVAGESLKNATGWDSFSGISNTNNSGFSAYPAGYCRRNTLYGYPDFDGKGRQGIFWTATLFSSGSEGDAFCVGLNYANNNATLYNTWKRFGFSIRCIKD